VKVNAQPVHDTSDFMHACGSRNGAAVSVDVIRDKKEQNLNLFCPTEGICDLCKKRKSLEGPADRRGIAVELSELQQEVARLQPQLNLPRKTLAHRSGSFARNSAGSTKKFASSQEAEEPISSPAGTTRADQEKLERSWISCAWNGWDTGWIFRGADDPFVTGRLRW